ncbi:MAG: DUF433 domain-containing protein [Bryobacteraceae bacterium]
MDVIPGFDRITVEPAQCGGKPCIRGMRITVRRVLEILAAYPNREQGVSVPRRRRPAANLRYAAAAVDYEVHPLNRVA